MYSGSSGTAGPLDIELAVTYYDFSKAHPDFDSVSYITMASPSYVASPYGAWLTVTGTPSAETLSQWYRFIDGVNYEVTSTLILTHQTGTVKRYSFYGHLLDHCLIVSREKVGKNNMGQRQTA